MATTILFTWQRDGATKEMQCRWIRQVCIISLVRVCGSVSPICAPIASARESSSGTTWPHHCTKFHQGFALKGF